MLLPNLRLSAPSRSMPFLSPTLHVLFFSILDQVRCYRLRKILRIHYVIILHSLAPLLDSAAQRRW